MIKSTGDVDIDLMLICIVCILFYFIDRGIQKHRIKQRGVFAISLCCFTEKTAASDTRVTILDEKYETLLKYRVCSSSNASDFIVKRLYVSPHSNHLD